MKEMNRNERTTFIFSTHDAKVMSHANAIVRLADGQIIDGSAPRPAPAWSALSGRAPPLHIALRNLFASFSNVVIGGIVFVGTLLVRGRQLALGQRGQRHEPEHHRQRRRPRPGLYSDKSKDELALFGRLEPRRTSRPSPTSPRCKRRCCGVPNVKTVVPMGVEQRAVVTYGNTVDLALEKLRKAGPSAKAAARRAAARREPQEATSGR